MVCDEEVFCCQAGKRLPVVVAVLNADMVAGGDGGNETVQNVPGSSLTLNVELSCQVLTKNEGALVEKGIAY